MTRAFYLLCTSTQLTSPPPAAEQVDEYGRSSWTPPNCTFQLRGATPVENRFVLEGRLPRGNTPHTVRIRSEYETIREGHSGWSLSASDARAVRHVLQQFYRCTIHNLPPSIHFRTSAWMRERNERNSRYRLLQLGNDIPWPDHVHEDYRAYRRFIYATPYDGPSTHRLWSS